MTYELQKQHTAEDSAAGNWAAVAAALSPDRIQRQTTLLDTEAIRLNLGADISIVFVPCVHFVVPEIVI